MLKSMTVAAALLLGVSTLALAQTQPQTSPSGSATSPSNPTAPSTGVSPSAPSTDTGATSRSGTTTGSGTSAMSQAELKKQVEQQGYSQVQLREDATGASKGNWTGTAMKGGKQVNIRVDANGRVTER